MGERCEQRRGTVTCVEERARGREELGSVVEGDLFARNRTRRRCALAEGPVLVAARRQAPSNAVFPSVKDRTGYAELSET